MKNTIAKTNTEQEFVKVLKRIIAKRKRLKMTQTDMARKLNMTLSGYFKVEKGKSKLDLIRLFEIADVLEVDVYEFFEK